MLTNNLYPVPQEQWPGFAGPVTVGNYDVGIHRAGTIAASVAGTLLATGVYAASGMESPTANIDTTTTDTYVIETDRQRTVTHDDAKFMQSASKKIGTRDVPVVETKTITGHAFLPDVPTFDLSLYPNAYKPTNGSDITSFTVQVKQAQENGWVITSAEGEGRSSDETRLDAQRGIGKKDGGNERLAAQYGDAGKNVFDSALSSAGVSLENVPYSQTSREVVITGEQRMQLDKKLAELGYASAAQFIDAYKADPSSLSPEARSVAAYFFEAHRGARLDLHMTRQTLRKEPIIEKFVTTRCLDDIRVDVTTVEHTVTDPGNFPIVPLLVPAIRIRRKDDFLTKQPKNKTTDEAATDNAVQETRVESSSTTDRGSRPSGSFVDGLPGDEPRQRSDRMTHRYTETRERNQDYSYRNWTLEDFRRQRNEEIRARLKFLGGLLVAASFIRLDAGYCPDPENWQQQQWSIDRALPDSVHLGVGIPFTDIESEKLEIISAFCKAEDEPDRNSTNQDEPNCDTRYTVYENGELVHHEETNYPGAITTTKTIK